MPTIIHKKIKPSACQATHYNGTRNKSITSSLARKGLKVSLITLLSIGGISSSIIGTSNTYADNRNLLFTVNATTPSLEISVPGSVALDVVPSSSGAFGYADINVQAGSSSSDGYKLMMYTTSVAHPTDLVGTKGSVIETLPAKSGGYTQEDFTVNKWGYKWSFKGTTATDAELHNPKTNYFPIISTTNGGNALTVTSNNSNAETTTITLATKLDNETPADSYSTLLSFVILANSSTDTSTFDAAFYANGKTTYTYQDATGTTVNTGLYAMQDMNSSICSDTFIPTPSKTDQAPETRLIDIRDKKVYWVAKLADGKCWMTQGLDLDLSSSVALTPTDSDVTANWTPINSTIDSSTKTITIQTTSSNISSSGFAAGWNNTKALDEPYSADPGDRYVLPTQSTKTYTNYWDLQDQYYNSLTACNSTTNNFTGDDCTHYQLGNFYNFAAATATNSVAATVGHTIADTDNYTDMPNSICPANWRLPHGLLAVATNGTASTNNSEFNTLLYAYGATANIGATAGQNIGYATSSGVNTGINIMRTSPLYFTRPGHVHGGTLHYAGVTGGSWSSTISATSSGHHLVFNSTEVYPAGSYNRYTGFPVRCVAR